MCNTPFFSVIIPLYNKEDYIESTLQSVINQTFQDFEIIVVNDGCTDNSLEIVNSIKDKRIEIIQQKNLGLSSARNTGIKKAKATNFAFLDADDLWTKDYLEIMYRLIIDNKTHSVFGCPVTIFYDEKVVNLEKSPFKDANVKIISNYFKLGRNLFGFSSVVIKKHVFDDVGYFKTNINFGEEEDFNIRCFQKHQLVYYNTSKAYYRKGVNNQLTKPRRNSNRKIPDYDVLTKNKPDKDLKKYIDFVHYKLIVLYKMELNQDKVKFYKKKIDTSNLSLTKKIKYHLPTHLFYFIKSIYQKF